MAANTNNSGNLSLTANLPGAAGRTGWSWKFWTRYNAVTNGDAVMGVDDAGSNYWQLMITSGELRPGWQTSPFEVSMFTPLPTRWLYLSGRFDSTSTASGTTVIGKNGISLGWTKVNPGNLGADPTGIYFGTDGYAEQATAVFAGITIWDALLTDDELKAEHVQTAPLRQRNLFHYESMQQPIYSLGRDQSGRGRNLTRAGTWTLSNFAPPVPELAVATGYSFLGL